MKLLIGADLVPTEHTEQKFIDKDLKYLFTNVLPVIKKADRFIINLECALTTSDNAIKKFGPNLKAHPGCAYALKELGVTDVMLSNNHTFDFGVEGLKDTVDALDKAGLPYAGIGVNDQDSRKIYYIEKDGVRVAIVDVCEHEYTYALPDRMGANPYDPYLTMQDVRKAKSTADKVIVIYHGGKEFSGYPSPRLRLLCQELCNNGADVVITQHSHCIGCYEEYNGAHILYGQGNLHFCYDKMHKGWYTSLLVELDIDKDVKIKFYPLRTLHDSILIPDGEDAKEIMDDFNKRNNELKTGEWKKGWHDFCVERRGVYDSTLKNISGTDTDTHDTQLFAHFLDCEAHTDVWRELYPTWNQTNEKEEK